MAFTQDPAQNQCHFLRIPRELRNIIYQLLLDDNCEPEPFDLEEGLAGCLVVTMPKRRRNQSVGYYVPFFLRFKDRKWFCSDDGYDMSTLFASPVMNDLPILRVCKEIRAEVLEIFTFGLEVFAEPGWKALKKWAGNLSKVTLLGIRQINLFLSVGKHVFSQSDGVQNKPWEGINTRRSPILRLEINGPSRTLVVKSCVRFIDTHAKMIQDAVHAYVAALPSSYQFTGRDLINIALLLPSIEQNILKLDGAAWREHKAAIGEDYTDYAPSEDDLAEITRFGGRREPEYQRFWAVEIAETNTKMIPRPEPSEKWKRWREDHRRRRLRGQPEGNEKPLTKEQCVLNGKFEYTIVEVPRHCQGQKVPTA
jgi:hypothetical protein